MPLRESIRWRSLQHGGLEQLRLYEWPEAFKIRSAVIGQVGDERHGVHYEMSVTPGWEFESILLQRTDGVMSVLSRGKGGEWFDMQVEPLPELAGCIDIDFEMTPFTNTLPIRRVPLAIGETRRFRVAYIPADTLEPYPTEQIYTRLADRVYRFEVADGSFSADITVDANGFVVDYPGLFERA